jgi:hypothetical protein
LNSVKSIRQIYALPTRFGIYLGFALIGGIALSSRLENNFLLLMLLFQMAVFFLSIIWSANNLKGIVLKIRDDSIFIPSIHHHIHIGIINTDQKFNILINKQEIKKREIELKVYDSHFKKRGKAEVSAIKIESFFPFSIVRCWLWLWPGSIYVAPRPYPIKSMNDIEKFLKVHAKKNNDDSYDHYRKYIDQDLPSMVDWKRYASKKIKLTKAFGNKKIEQKIKIDGDELIRKQKEHMLSIICGVLLFCQSKKIDWQLSLRKKTFSSEKKDFNAAIKSLSVA